MSWQDAGWIYILDDGLGHYKIGRAKILDRRIKQLKIQLPFKVTVAYAFFVDHYELVESKLHRELAERRLNGEWFALDLDHFAQFHQMARFQGYWEDRDGQMWQDAFCEPITEAEALARATDHLERDHLFARQCRYLPLSANAESSASILEIAQYEDFDEVEDSDDLFGDSEYQSYLKACDEDSERQEARNRLRAELGDCAYYDSHHEGCPHHRRVDA